ncbi:amidoligase family protein [Hydrogenimonas urashimensis]|uniref:amidoligase family protein n=1 Tax=Hydrogenimonas urashimensis TaxID=2740515 RepID=UPI0019152566|nr:amidoligase family protein [Hydrogenimonas urashimensis]
MNMKDARFHQPPILTNANGEPRKVGFELEYAGLTLVKSAAIVMKKVGGRIDVINPYHIKIRDTEYGTFTLVLDFQFLVESGLEKWLHTIGLDQALEKETVEAIERFIADLSETVVPYEISTSPLPLERIGIIESVKEELRKHGAMGTKADPLYAFGFHINPEAARITVENILNTLRAFFLLYDYLVERIKPDMTRRLTPYIDPFDREYVELVLDPSYDPTMIGLIDDYLEYNPTRNRALDLLPLFAWIDVDRVMAQMEGEKIAARPTYHYRLPNSRVDEAEWCTCEAWNSWVLVERLANDEEALKKLANECLQYLDSPLAFFKKEAWIDRVRQWVEKS